MAVGKAGKMCLKNMEVYRPIPSSWAHMGTTHTHTHTHAHTHTYAYLMDIDTHTHTHTQNQDFLFLQIFFFPLKMFLGVQQNASL